MTEIDTEIQKQEEILFSLMQEMSELRLKIETVKNYIQTKIEQDRLRKYLDNCKKMAVESTEPVVIRPLQVTTNEKDLEKHLVEPPQEDVGAVKVAPKPKTETPKAETKRMSREQSQTTLENIKAVLAKATNPLTIKEIVEELAKAGQTPHASEPLDAVRYLLIYKKEFFDSKLQGNKSYYTLKSNSKESQPTNNPKTDVKTDLKAAESKAEATETEGQTEKRSRMSAEGMQTLIKNIENVFRSNDRPISIADIINHLQFQNSEKDQLRVRNVFFKDKGKLFTKVNWGWGLYVLTEEKETKGKAEAKKEPPSKEASLPKKKEKQHLPAIIDIPGEKPSKKTKTTDEILKEALV